MSSGRGQKWPGPQCQGLNGHPGIVIADGYGTYDARARASCLPANIAPIVSWYCSFLMSRRGAEKKCGGKRRDAAASRSMTGSD